MSQAQLNRIESIISGMAVSIQDINHKQQDINHRLNHIDHRLYHIEHVQHVIEKEMNGMKLAIDPTLDKEFCDIPVISKCNDIGLGNRSTYSWINYGGVDVIVGAAHCALSLCTDSSELLFIELPEAITNLFVTHVYLLHPETFNNIDENRCGIPTQYDIVVIEVKTGFSGNKERISKYKQTTPENAQKMESRLFGLTPVGIVSSKNSIVYVQTTKSSEGTLSFFLDEGEPGDSGTLLHTKGENGELEAKAIFTGVTIAESCYKRRGLAAVLPKRGSFSEFEVIDATNIQQLDIVDFVSGKPEEMKVRVLSDNNLKAVNLEDFHGKKMAHGVIVNIKKLQIQRIPYLGKMECP